MIRDFIFIVFPLNVSSFLSIYVGYTSLELNSSKDLRHLVAYLEWLAQVTGLVSGAILTVIFVKMALVWKQVPK